MIQLHGKYQIKSSRMKIQRQQVLPIFQSIYSAVIGSRMARAAEVANICTLRTIFVHNIPEVSYRQVTFGDSIIPIA